MSFESLTLSRKDGASIDKAAVLSWLYSSDCAVRFETDVWHVSETYRHAMYAKINPSPFQTFATVMLYSDRIHVNAPYAGKACRSRVLSIFETLTVEGEWMMAEHGYGPAVPEPWNPARHFGDVPAIGTLHDWHAQQPVYRGRLVRLSVSDAVLHIHSEGQLDFRSGTIQTFARLTKETLERWNTAVDVLSEDDDPELFDDDNIWIDIVMPGNGEDDYALSKIFPRTDVSESARPALAIITPWIRAFEASKTQIAGLEIVSQAHENVPPFPLTQKIVLVLRHEVDQDGFRHTEATYNDAGSFVISGQDFGSGVSNALGHASREYEWSFTFTNAMVDRLTTLMAGMFKSESTNIFEVLRRVPKTFIWTTEFLDEHQIEFTFWSRIE